MWQSATPAAQNDITTCLETFAKERFQLPKTRDSRRDALEHQNTFSYEFSYEPPNLLPQNRGFVQGFRQFSSHLTTCHACHGICTLSPLDAALRMRFAKNTQRDTSKKLRLPRRMTMNTFKVLRLPRKLQRIFWKRRKSIAPATQSDFRHVTKHVWMSQNATPAMRNEASRRLKPPKMTTFAKLTIGTAIRPHADGWRTVAVVNATSSKHTLKPRTPSETGTLATHSGRKGLGIYLLFIYIIFIYIYIDISIYNQMLFL